MPNVNCHTRTLGALFVMSALGSVFALTGCPEPPPPVYTEYTYTVIEEYPHDPDAFTQGLVWDNGALYEGTGLYGASTLREVDLSTGDIIRMVALSDDHFGEGITTFDDRIVQITWQTRTAFDFATSDLSLNRTYSYQTEGWGITHDGERLIMSDGTDTLYFRDPETFEVLGTVAVRELGQPVIRLNELEYIGGEVFANVWLTDRIVRINPETGEVTGRIDLTGLLPAEDRDGTENVLNGIAYDAENDRLYVTGKLWPKLYWIELVPIDPNNASQKWRHAGR